jgi:hypothetical protein
MRRGNEEANRKIAQEQERMACLLMKAAESAQPHLAKGDIAAAIEAASVEYSGSSASRVVGINSAMFRVSGDSVTIRRTDVKGSNGLEMRAVNSGAMVICIFSGDGPAEVEKTQSDMF